MSAADLIDACLTRGLAFKAASRLEAALAAFDAALEIDPNCVAGLVNRAGILIKLGRYDDALTASERALTLSPAFATAHCNRGLAFAGLDRWPEALHCYERALAAEPDHVPSLGNRGKALQALNRDEEALAAYARVMELQPDGAQAYVNSAHTHLALGRFERGWELYEWRKRLAAPLGHRTFAEPAWLGRCNIRGRTLLLHWEQGLGDTIQFCRYALMAVAAGAKVLLLTQPRLRRLLRTLHPEITVITEDELASHRFDMHCPLLSLPLAFATRLETVPAQVPYLAAEPERVKAWRERLGVRGFKIGINWQGNGRSPADRGRSFPLRLFRRIATLPGVRLISLQVGDGTEQLRQASSEMRIETLGPEFDAGPDAFLDTAGVIECLDLIITSDTAVTHLSGALARPTWVALQPAADWRWLKSRTDCPWYPTLRLFRQPQRGRWDEVFGSLEAALCDRLASEGGKQAP